MIQNVTGEDFQVEVLKAEKPVLAYFTATWCGPCRAISPMIDKLAEEFEGKMKSVKIDIERADEVARIYKIRGVPTFILINKGEEVDRYVGVTMDEAQFRKVLDAFTLAKDTD